MTRVAILQPNYIPWRGYFDLIHRVDTFVFLDDVQYTKGDWRNRNKVCVLGGKPTWLTVPVVVTGLGQLICNVEIDNRKPWARKHVSTLKQNYGKAPFFDHYFSKVASTLEFGHRTISDLDIELAKTVCTWLGLDRTFVKSSELNSSGSKDHRLIDIVRSVGGSYYLSGPAAKAYIQPNLWEDAGIELDYIDYPAYPAYPQINAEFESQVSILDLLFMVGPNAPNYIWGQDHE